MMISLCSYCYEHVLLNLVAVCSSDLWVSLGYSGHDKREFGDSWTFNFDGQYYTMIHGSSHQSHHIFNWPVSPSTLPLAFLMVLTNTVFQTSQLKTWIILLQRVTQTCMSYEFRIMPMICMHSIICSPIMPDCLFAKNVSHKYSNQGNSLVISIGICTLSTLWLLEGHFK